MSKEIFIVTLNKRDEMGTLLTENLKITKMTKKQLRSLRDEMGCNSYDEAINLLLYHLGIHEDSLNLPAQLVCKNFRNYLETMPKKSQ